MMKRALLSAVLIWLCWTGCCVVGQAQDTLADITARCKFAIGPFVDHVDVLFDGDPMSSWATAKSTAYLQIYKPSGKMTLSVLWGKKPRGASLQQRIDGKLVDLLLLPDDGALHEAIPLPEAAGVYYLCVKRGTSIAEVRVHPGVQQISFFTSNGYPEGPVNAWPSSSRHSPDKRTSISDAILEMKKTLVSLGYDVGKMSRLFNLRASIALPAFQRACGLYPTAVLDRETQAALLSPPPQATCAPNEAPGSLPRTASAMVDFFRSKLGDGYVYGAYGQICDTDLRDTARNVYPEYAQVLFDYAYRWDGSQAFDCIGLFKAFLNASKGEVPREWISTVSGSVARWMTEPQPIETMPNQPGIILLQFEPNQGYMHTGLYIGDGLCVHARGHRYGVVLDAMPQLWTHWARAEWLDYDLPEQPKAGWPPTMQVGERALVDTGTGNAINLYKKPKEDLRYWTGVRIANYSEVLITEVPTDASFWRVIEATDSKGRVFTGYVYAKDLSPLDPPTLPEK